MEISKGRYEEREMLDVGRAVMSRHARDERHTVISCRIRIDELLRLFEKQDVS